MPALKAVLVATLVGAAGEPLVEPTLLGQEDLAACNRTARAAVEALALAHPEKAMPAREPGTAIEAAQDKDGVWTVRYRYKAPGGAEGEAAARSSTAVRAVCREAP